jgi:hypothetical protein
LRIPLDVCEIRRPEKREGADSKFALPQKAYYSPERNAKQEERALMGAILVVCFVP